MAIMRIGGLLRGLTLLVLAAGGGSSQNVSEPELPGRVKEHIVTGISDLANYTCLETMERTTKAPSGATEIRERLRLEVLVADRKELFAWPGSAKFTAEPLDKWIAEGAIGTGSFQGELSNLFATSATTIQYAGTEGAGGKALERFDFHMPLSSGRKLIIQGASATIAYSGSFWVNQQSLDLVRLETRSENIPSQINVREEHGSVTYGDRLLPSASELAVVFRDGHENHNTVTFSGCRRYSVETSLSFDGPATASEGTQEKATRTLQPKITLDLKLEQPISTKDSAVGDAVVAVLDKGTSGPVRLPKGTRVVGRIRRLEQHFQPLSDFTVVGLEFFAAETPAGRVEFEARLVGPAATPDRQVMEMNATVPSVMPGAPGLDIDDDPKSGGIIFRVHGKNLNLPRGFRTVWETQ